MEDNMIAGHTPGKWSADGANILYCAPSVDDQFDVLEVNAPYNCQDRQLIAYIPAGFEHSDANAALIAAAPVMLEALNHALAVCEAEAELRGENDTDDYQGGAAGPVAEMIRAAIALAAGKS